MFWISEICAHESFADIYKNMEQVNLVHVKQGYFSATHRRYWEGEREKLKLQTEIFPVTE